MHTVLWNQTDKFESDKLFFTVGARGAFLSLSPFSKSRSHRSLNDLSLKTLHYRFAIWLSIIEVL